MALEAILAANPGRRVAVVTHAAIINAYLTMLLGIDRDMFFLPSHTSITALRFAQGRYAPQSSNDTGHLASTPDLRILAPVA